MNDLQAIRGRMTQLLWDGAWEMSPSTRAAVTADADGQLDTLVPGDVPGTLCWPDVDYEDQVRTDWKTSYHYARLLNLTQTNGPERLRTDAAYREKIIGALRFWLCHDFQNPNWWYNDIGMPRTLSDLALLLYDVLDKETFDRTVELVSRGSMATRDDIAQRWTGANLVWGSLNTIKHALLIEDEELLARAVQRTGQELQVGEEGIQSDGSFFQHGPRLYSGGYGRSFAFDIAQICFALQGTKFQFSGEQLSTFLVHVLDGLRYMTQGDMLDYACVGREFTRAGGVHVGLVQRAVGLLVRTEGLPRQEELRSYLAAMQQKTSPLRGTKYFPKAAFLCHHIDGLYVGAKFHNNRLWDAEICNNEGELCYNMSYGTHTCIMVDGSEYNDISPVWAYDRIPGTTARTENDEQLLAHRDWWCLPLPSSHSGGAQNGERAVIYEIAEHDGVEAFVTDFAFEGGFVSLGAGVRTVGEPHETLVTTVDQCFLQEEPVREGEHIVHHGVRYTGLADTHIAIHTQTVHGSWYRNNFPESKEDVSANLLTLTISHAAGTMDEYAYMVSPAGAPAPAVTVLRNDSDVQAIRLPDGSVMAAFHKPCALVFSDRCVCGEPGGYIENK